MISRRLLVPVLLVLIGSFFCAGTALGATTRTVTNTNDSGSGSLRDAIATSVAGDTIQFAPALDGQTITLTSGELLINHNLTISGPGAGQLTISANLSSRVFDLQADTVMISGLTVTQGLAPGSQGGGAILDLGGPNGGTLTLLDDAVTSSEIVLDTGGGGGLAIGATTLNPVNVNVIGSTFANDKQTAIYQFNPGTAGTLSISNSTFTNNQHGPLGASGPGSGGALFLQGNAVVTNSTFTGNQASSGGAIYAQDGANSLSVSNSTFTANHAVGAVSFNPTGGAFFIQSGAVTLTDDTLTANSADGNGSSGFGGGIFTCCGNGGSVNLVNDTVDANSVTGPSSAGGDIASDTTAPAARILNSIVADGSAGIAAAQNCGGFETSLGHNISTGNCGFTAAGDQINTSPKLGPLASNGGPTQTMALLPGSPAIDTGSNPGCPAIDQRGVPRPQGTACDVGAFEYQPTTSQPNPQPKPQPKPLCSLSVKSKVSFGKAKHTKQKKARPGFLVAALKCDQAVSATLKGALKEHLKKKHARAHKKTLSLGQRSASLGANVAHTFKIKLSKAELKALANGTRESVTLTMTVSNGNGSNTTTASVARLKR